MIKLKSSLLLVPLMTLGVLMPAAAQKAPNPGAPVTNGTSDDLIELTHLRSSRMLLGQLMEDPILHQIYLERQLRSLTHPIDRALRSFFLADPNLSQFYQLAVKEQQNFLVDYERYADTTMFRLTRGVTKVYDRLDHIVEETARDLGFSPEAVENRRIYIKEGSGSINAFTVSGSQEKVIVVVHSTLLEKMDEFEVRAILGHELGHIRASHTVNGVLLESMLQLIYLHFSGGASTASASAPAFSKTFLEKRIASLTNMVNGVVGVIMRSPSEQRLELMQKFMGFVNVTLREMDVPRETIEFFAELTEDLPKAGKIRVDVNQMKKELSVLSDAISRAQENTADRFGSSISKNAYLASAMGKLLGMAFANENREGVLKSLMAQAEQFYQNVSPEERAYFMGGSHPVPVLRTHMIMNFSPLPDIFFANPFIALLILEDSLVENIVALKATPLTTVNKDDPRTTQTRKLEIAVRDHFDQLLDKLDLQIVDHLMQTEQRLRPGGRNPRFDNMMQFILVRKEMLFEEKVQLQAQIDELRREGKEGEVAALQKQVQTREQQLKVVGASILGKVREAMKTVEISLTASEAKKQDAKLRIQQIDVALKAANSMEGLQEYRTLRMELTTLPKNRTKGSRIPIECRLFVY